MKRSSTKPDEKKINTKRLIPIVVAALLILMLVFGAVLGIIALVREATAVVSYGGVTLTEGVAAYLASTFKQSYLRYLNESGIDAIDSEIFWLSEDMDGVPFGDTLREECELYIRKVTVAAYLFDRHSSIDSDARSWLADNVAEVLDYKADGSEKLFNEQSSAMGFTYKDFVAATELLYKAENAVTAIYGTDGSALASNGNISICEDYLKEYSHVKLLFVRHNDAFELDEEGNRITEDGRDRLVALSADEKAERQADISDITEAIENIALGADGQMSELYFNSFYEKYNDDPENAAGGYYFSASSECAAAYAEMYGDAVIKALTMDIGDYDRSDVDEDGDGVTDVTVFIYRYATTPYAYAISSYAAFFEDFYTDASTYHFETSIEELASGVNVKDGYWNIDVAAIAPNNKFYIS